MWTLSWKLQSFPNPRGQTGSKAPRAYLRPRKPQPCIAVSSSGGPAVLPRVPVTYLCVPCPPPSLLLLCFGALLVKQGPSITALHSRTADLRGKLVPTDKPQAVQTLGHAGSVGDFSSGQGGTGQGTSSRSGGVPAHLCPRRSWPGCVSCSRSGPYPGFSGVVDRMQLHQVHLERLWVSDCTCLV